MGNAALKSSRRGSSTANDRTRRYRAVHAAARSNGMDDDDRKALQLKLIGKASLSDMDDAEITTLLDHLNRNRKAPAGHRAHIGKIKALWWSLYWLGEVESAEERVISAFVKRQTRVTALRFIDHRSAPSVIEALKSWLSRVGVNWPSSDQIDAATLRHPCYTASHAERLAVLDAIIRRLGETNLLADFPMAAAGQPFPFGVERLDSMIRDAGARLRAERK